MKKKKVVVSDAEIRMLIGVELGVLTGFIDALKRGNLECTDEMMGSLKGNMKAYHQVLKMMDGSYQRERSGE